MKAFTRIMGDTYPEDGSQGWTTRLTNHLTALSGYYVDWNNIAKLLKQGHGYTWQEILVRAGIAVSTIAGAGVGYSCHLSWNPWVYQRKKVGL